MADPAVVMMEPEKVNGLPERDWIPISAIEHYSYCPRQCALIHLEQIFEENAFTVRGQVAHERVDAETREVRGELRRITAVPLWSSTLGLYGKADVVELRRRTPYPIEHKVGERVEVHANLQLCAQALCLEEMLGLVVPRGAIYSHQTRRRTEVRFDDELRNQTLEAIAGVRELLQRQRLPNARNDRRCPRCSLIDVCLPKIVTDIRGLRSYQASLYRPLSSEELDGV
jgi:CRISPR-associated exonuclease Cas4